MRELRRAGPFLWVCAGLGALLVVFAALPVLNIVIGTPLAALGSALLDPELQDALVTTFTAGVLATLLGLAGGIPLAYVLARRKFPLKWLVQGAIDLPIVIPHTAAGVALLMVWGARGPVGSPLSALGLTFSDSVLGAAVAMLFVSASFLVNSARDAFAMVNPELERVAETMGATPAQAFRHVTLPLAWRGVLSGALLMWARGVSEFGAVVMLAYHPKTLPVLVYERFQGFGLSAATPVAAVLILVAVVVFAATRALAGRGR